jgi:hypothetical protein
VARGRSIRARRSTGQRPFILWRPHQTRTLILCNACRTGLQDDALKECQTQQGEHPTEGSVEECAKNLAKEMKESMEREPDYRRISFSGESYERVRRLCSRFAIRPRPLRAGSCQGEVGEGSAICRRPCTCDEVYGRLDRHRSLPLPWYTWKKEVVIVINNNQWAISAPRSI